MVRFILSWVLVLGCWMGLGSLKAAQNTKRPTSLPPTLLTQKAVTTTKVVTKAATTLAKATGNVINEEVTQAEAKAKKLASASAKALGKGLARVTAYWSGEGDYYTRHHISSTGIHLHSGHCAVDPTIIPYGSVVQIEGLGTYLAVDTGTAVVSRRAARESGHNKSERHALVVDIYFESRSAGEKFAAGGARFAAISWYMPGAEVASDTTSARTLAAFDGGAHSKTL